MARAEGPLPKSEVDRIVDNAVEEEYGRLRDTPGFCIDAVSWSRLQELIRVNTEESLGKLGRTPADIRVYRHFRQEILHQYRSVADFVQITKLDFDSVEDEDGIRRAADPPPDEDGKPHITFHQNDFPYNFDAGMQHHCIWCTRQLSDDELAEVIRQHRAGWEVRLFLRHLPTIGCDIALGYDQLLWERSRCCSSETLSHWRPSPPSGMGMLCQGEDELTHCVVWVSLTNLLG